MRAMKNKGVALVEIVVSMIILAVSALAVTATVSLVNSKQHRSAGTSGQGGKGFATSAEQRLYSCPIIHLVVLMYRSIQRHTSHDLLWVAGAGSLFMAVLSGFCY